MGASPTVMVRQMRGEDVSAVANLTTQLGYPASEDDVRRRYDRIAGRPDAQLFVAEHPGNHIVGWVHVQELCLLECDPRAEIWGLVVDETIRGTGVGRRLIEAAEEWALARGLSMMALRSNQLRTGAKGFYEHLGYKVTKTQNAFRKSL